MNKPENCHRCGMMLRVDLYMDETYCPRCEGPPSSRNDRTERDVGI